MRAREGSDLEERGVRVEQQVDALAGGEPAALVVAVDVLRAPRGEHGVDDGVDLGQRGEHRVPVGGEVPRRRVEAAHERRRM